MGLMKNALKLFNEALALRNEEKRKELALKAATKILNHRRGYAKVMGPQLLLGINQGLSND